MRRLLIAILLVVVAASASAFPLVTNKETFTGTPANNWTNFTWTWPDQTDHAMDITVQQGGLSGIMFRLAFPAGGSNYLTVQDGVFASSTTQSTWYAVVPRTNIPPNAVYYAEFLGIGNTNTVDGYTRVLASGRVRTRWSVWDATNAAAWQSTVVGFTSTPVVAGVASISNTGPVSGAIVFTGSSVTQTGTTFNFAGEPVDLSSLSNDVLGAWATASNAVPSPTNEWNSGWVLGSTDGGTTTVAVALPSFSESALGTVTNVTSSDTSVVVTAGTTQPDLSVTDYVAQALSGYSTGTPLYVYNETQTAAGVSVALSATTYTAATQDVEAHLTGIESAMSGFLTTASDPAGVYLPLAAGSGNPLGNDLYGGGFALQNFVEWYAPGGAYIKPEQDGIHLSLNTGNSDILRPFSGVQSSNEALVHVLGPVEVTGGVGGTNTFTIANKKATAVGGLAITADTQNIYFDSSPIQGGAVNSGFWSQEAQTVAFDPATRTVTVTPTGASFKVTTGGVVYEYTNAQVSTAGPDTSGSFYTYFDAATGDLICTNVAWTILGGEAQVLFTLYDATRTQEVYSIDERHLNKMTDRTHVYLHKTIGTAWASGLALYHFASDTAAAAGANGTNTVVALQAGEVWDEDVQHTIAAQGTSANDTNTAAVLPVIWKDASGVWHREVGTQFPFLWSNATPLYVTSAGAQTVVPEDNYFVQWLLVLGTPSSNEVMTLSHPAVFASTQAARDGATISALSSALGGFPSVEILTAYRLIYLHNASAPNAHPASVKNSKLRFVDDFRYLSSGVILAGGSTAADGGATNATLDLSGTVTTAAYDSVTRTLALSGTAGAGGATQLIAQVGSSTATSTISGAILSISNAASAAGSYTLIDEWIPDGTANTVTFSAIPQTYSHLEIIGSTYMTSPERAMNEGVIRPNNDTNTASYTILTMYHQTIVGATNTQIVSYQRTVGGWYRALLFGGTSAAFRVSIPVYADTSTPRKTMVSNWSGRGFEGGGERIYTGQTMGDWTGSTITSLVLYTYWGSNVVGGKVSLYGVE